MTFLREEKGSLSLALHIQPRASKNRIVGLHGENLKLAVTAPPADGKANKAVVKFLADFFSIPKKGINIKSGLQSRKKRVLLTGISLAGAREKIDAVLEG